MSVCLCVCVSVCVAGCACVPPISIFRGCLFSPGAMPSASLSNLHQHLHGTDSKQVQPDAGHENHFVSRNLYTAVKVMTLQWYELFTQVLSLVQLRLVRVFIS